MIKKKAQNSKATPPEAPQKPSESPKKAKKHPTGVLILIENPAFGSSSVKKFGKTTGLSHEEARFVWEEFLRSKSKTIADFAHDLCHDAWDDPDGTYPYSRGRAEAIVRDILDEFAARGYLSNLPPEEPRKAPKEYKRLKEDLDCPVDAEKFGNTGIDNERAHLIWSAFKTSTHETLEDFAQELLQEGWDDANRTTPYTKRKAASYLQDVIAEFQKRGLIE